MMRDRLLDSPPLSIQTDSRPSLDRDVVAEDQIRLVIRTFRDKLAEIFPGRKEVPKTLVFAKTDLHAEDIVKTLLKVNGRCAIVVPDNVLFEGGAGETVRRNLLKQFDVHTLLRLPTGVFYAQGVKANVLFFDARPAQEKPWTTRLWVYDLRTNMHFTLKTNPLRRADLDEFVACYRPGRRHDRKPTWSEATPEGRWRVFDYEELVKRDKVNLDLFWLKDKSLEESDDLPDPDVLAQEIADDLQTALEQFAAIAEKLKG
jgi:type I restriction enzyme M protein